MNFEKLKNLIKRNGDTFIFLEGGEPEMVLLSFHEYERLRSSTASPAVRQSPGVPLTQMTPDDTTFLSDIDEDVYATPYTEAEPFSEIPTSLSGFEGFRPSPEAERLDNRNQNMPLRREDVRLEDLPI